MRTAEQGLELQQGPFLQVQMAVAEANAFALASHIYWGVWAILQVRPGHTSQPTAASQMAGQVAAHACVHAWEAGRNGGGAMHAGPVLRD